MITKQELIDKISSLANGGDNTPDTRYRYHPSDIEAVIDSEYINILNSIYRPEEDMDMDMYSQPYHIDVLFDENRNEFYSVLPVDVVPLPENSGIRLVSPLQDQSVQIVPISNNGNFIFSKLESQMWSESATYYIEKSNQSGYRLYYQFRGEEYKKLLIKLITTFETMKYDTKVIEPSVMTKTSLLTLSDIVISKLRNQPAVSLSNDNNANV